MVAHQRRKARLAEDHLEGGTPPELRLQGCRRQGSGGWGTAVHLSLTAQKICFLCMKITHSLDATEYQNDSSIHASKYQERQSNAVHKTEPTCHFASADHTWIRWEVIVEQRPF
jgi:hypothetical protein